MGNACSWSYSGRGFERVRRTPRKWEEMPAYYQGLDVLVCPSRVEGGPMPVLEALSCGVRVVVPRGVGIVDELPDVRGIHRYERGSVTQMEAALHDAIGGEPNQEALRASVERHSVEAWCASHREGFERWMS
jgi:glycosyltransferase involved in cell wall biosynthesis